MWCRFWIDTGEEPKSAFFEKTFASADILPRAAGPLARCTKDSYAEIVQYRTTIDAPRSRPLARLHDRDCSCVTCGSGISALSGARPR